MKNISFLVAIGAVLFLSSCEKDVQQDFSPSFDGEMSTLVAPEGFDWKTHQDVKFEFQSSRSGLLEIRNGEGVSIHKAFLSSNSKLEIDLGLAAKHSKVKVIFMGEELELPVRGGTVVHNF